MKYLLVSIAIACGAAHADEQQTQPQRDPFVVCLFPKIPDAIKPKLRMDYNSVDARTDDSPISKRDRDNLKITAKAWEGCLPESNSDNGRQYLALGMEPFINGASGKLKLWKEFHAERRDVEMFIKADIDRHVQEAGRLLMQAQESQKQAAAQAAMEQANREAAQRQLEAQQRMIDAQERMARENAINNGLNNLIQSMQPWPVTPMFAPQMNCNSRATGLGNVQTNCW